MTSTVPPGTLPRGAPRLRTSDVPLTEAVVATSPTCPTCGGDWWRGLTFDHRTDCGLRDQQDAAAARDQETFRRQRTSLTSRTVTAAERLLAAAVGVPITARTNGALVEVRLLTPGCAKAVRLGGFDLDRLATAQELAALKAVVSA